MLRLSGRDRTGRSASCARREESALGIREVRPEEGVDPAPRVGGRDGARPGAEDASEWSQRGRPRRAGAGGGPGRGAGGGGGGPRRARPALAAVVENGGPRGGVPFVAGGPARRGGGALQSGRPPGGGEIAPAVAADDGAGPGE